MMFNILKLVIFFLTVTTHSEFSKKFPIDIIELRVVGRTTDYSVVNNVQELSQKIRASTGNSRRRLLKQFVHELEPVAVCNKPELLLSLTWAYLQLTKKCDLVGEAVTIQRGRFFGAIVTLSKHSNLEERYRFTIGNF
jgi:hypothetical protein